MLVFVCAIFDRKDILQRKFDLVKLKIFPKLEYFLPGVILCWQKILVCKTQLSRSCWLNQQSNLNEILSAVFINDLKNSHLTNILACKNHKSKSLPNYARGTGGETTPFLPRKILPNRQLIYPVWWPVFSMVRCY